MASNCCIVAILILILVLANDFVHTLLVRKYVFPYSEKQAMSSRPQTKGNRKFQFSMVKEDSENPWRCRRGFISSLFSGSSIFWFSTAVCAIDNKKQTIKGAAELDLEYYLKDLFTGNNPSPSVKRPEMLQSARKLDPDFARALEDLTFQGIVRESGKSSSEIEDLMDSLREKVQRVFQSKAPFDPDDVSDQYRFDMNSYVQYKIAMMTIESLIRRVNLVRSVGEGVLVQLQALPNSLLKQAKVYDASQGSISPALVSLENVLKEFQRVNFIKGYKLSIPEDVEEDWKDGFVIEIPITVYEPATLGAALQFAGEKTLFHPDYVASSLSLFLKKYGVKAKYQEYFIDSTYRPDPTEYQASEVLINLSLEKKL